MVRSRARGSLTTKDFVSKRHRGGGGRGLSKSSSSTSGRFTLAYQGDGSLVLAGPVGTPCASNAVVPWASDLQARREHNSAFDRHLGCGQHERSHCVYGSSRAEEVTAHFRRSPLSLGDRHSFGVPLQHADERLCRTAR